MDKKVNQTLTGAAAPGAAKATPATQAATTGAPAAPAAGTAPTSAAPANSANANSNLQFNSADIGKWKSKQENPFAAQNRQDAATAAKKAEKKATRKAKTNAFKAKIAEIPGKVWAIGGAVLGAIIIVTVVTIMVIKLNQPEGSGSPLVVSSEEQLGTYHEALDNAFKDSLTSEEDDDGAGRDAVENAVNESLNTDFGREHETEIRLQQLQAYTLNEDCYRADEIAEMINPDELDLDQKITYYDSRMSCADYEHDDEASIEYFEKRNKLLIEKYGEE